MPRIVVRITTPRRLLLRVGALALLFGMSLVVCVGFFVVVMRSEGDNWTAFALMYVGGVGMLLLQRPLAEAWCFWRMARRIRRIRRIVEREGERHD